MGWFTWLFHIYTDGHKSGHRSPFLRCFSCKTAFLKSKFKDDPVRVQRHTVSHFKGLFKTFKMRYSMSLYSDGIIFKFRFQKSRFTPKNRDRPDIYSSQCTFML